MSTLDSHINGTIKWAQYKMKEHFFFIFIAYGELKVIEHKHLAKGYRTQVPCAERTVWIHHITKYWTIFFIYLYVCYVVERKEHPQFLKRTRAENAHSCTFPALAIFQPKLYTLHKCNSSVNRKRPFLRTPAFQQVTRMTILKIFSLD